MKPTEAQQRVIEHREGPLVVGAGAGAGKTRVLVERLMRLLASGSCNLDEVVIITFTRKAAAELTTRIGSLLEEQIAASSGREREFWLAQHRLLPAAAITTIHGFCGRLLRQYPLQANLDPGFNVMDETEAIFELRELVDVLLKETLERGDVHLDVLTKLFDRQRVSDTVLAVYLRLRTWGLEPGRVPLPDEQQHRSDVAEWQQLLNRLAELFDAVEQLENEEGLSKSLSKRVNDWLRAWPPFPERLSKLQQVTQYPVRGEHFEEAADWLVLLQETVSRRYFGVNVQKSVKPLIDELKLFLRELLPPKLVTLFEPGFKQFLRDLLIRLHREYESRKQSTLSLDFEDLQIRACALLRNDERVRDECRQRYRYIMVDEYQDTNGLQRELLQLLTHTDDEPGSANVMIVGDPKQSIYRFRGAEVDVFGATREDLLRRNGREVEMAENFRSEPVLIDFQNWIFSALLDEDTTAGIPFQPAIAGLALQGEHYESDAPLAETSTQGERENPAGTTSRLPAIKGTRGTIASSSASDAFAQSVQSDSVPRVKAAAGQVNGASSSAMSMHSAGHSIRGGHDGEQHGSAEPSTKGTVTWLLTCNTGKDGDRAVEAERLAAYLREQIRRQGWAYADVALLFRSLKQSKEYEDALQRYELPFTVLAGSGLYDRQEIKDLLHALLYLENRWNELALVGLLRSPMFFINDRSLYRLAQQGGVATAFHRDDVRLDDPEQDYLLQRARSVLSELKLKRTYMSLAGLLQAIVQCTDYERALACQIDGVRALANVDRLIELAYRFEQRGARGTRQFLQYVRQLRQFESREAEAALATGDSLTLMSVHSAKGLEWPVVVLPDLQRQLKQDIYPFAFERHSGLHVSLRLPKAGSSSGGKADSEAMQDFRARELEAEHQESRRLFYVAVTRARRHLILSSAIDEFRRSDDVYDLKRWVDWLAWATGVEMPDLTSGSEEFPDAAASPDNRTDGEDTVLSVPIPGPSAGTLNVLFRRVESVAELAEASNSFPVDGSEQHDGMSKDDVQRDVPFSSPIAVSSTLPASGRISTDATTVEASDGAVSETVDIVAELEKMEQLWRIGEPLSPGVAALSSSADADSVCRRRLISVSALNDLIHCKRLFILRHRLRLDPTLDQAAETLTDVAIEESSDIVAGLSPEALLHNGMFADSTVVGDRTLDTFATDALSTKSGLELHTESSPTSEFAPSLSGAQMGDWAHQLIRYDNNEERLAAWWQLARRAGFDATTSNALFRQLNQLLVRFDQHELAELSRIAEQRWDEHPFQLNLGPRWAVRGRIDRLLVYGHRRMIVDFKSHAIPSEAVPAVAKRYRTQLAVYTAAVNAALPVDDCTGDQPIETEAYLYFLNPGVAWSMHPRDLEPNQLSKTLEQLHAELEQLHEGSVIDHMRRLAHVEACAGCPYAAVCSSLSRDARRGWERQEQAGTG